MYKRRWECLRDQEVRFYLTVEIIGLDPVDGNLKWRLPEQEWIRLGSHLFGDLVYVQWDEEHVNLNWLELPKNGGSPSLSYQWKDEGDNAWRGGLYDFQRFVDLVWIQFKDNNRIFKLGGKLCKLPFPLDKGYIISKTWNDSAVYIRGRTRMSARSNENEMGLIKLELLPELC